MKRNIDLAGLLSLLLWMAAGLPVHGQAGAAAPAYRTLKLEAIAGELAAKGITIRGEGLYDAGSLCPGKQVAMKHDLFGKVRFIGLHLFGDRVKREYVSPVYEFVERYFLELLLAGSNEAAGAKLEEDKVSLTFNGTPCTGSLRRLADYIAPLAEGTPLAITSDAEQYTVGWNLPEGTLTLVFPKQYELIIGSDKAEMEKGLMEELARAEARSDIPDTLGTDVLEPSPKKGYYIRKGGHYLTNDMHSDTYYREIGNGKAALVFDAALPAESLANLFQEGWCGSDRRITLKVDHRCYGNQHVRFELELPQWVAYCKQNGCDVYFGMEQADGQVLKGTVIVVNSDLGYTHTLYFDCPADVFSRLRPDISATLYSYAPTHNIKDLFNDFK